MKNYFIILLMVSIFIVNGCNTDSPTRNKNTSYLQKTTIIIEPEPIIEAQQIITRAKEISFYIPDSSCKKIIDFGLSQMVIVKTDENGKAEFLYQNQFVLLITKGKNMKEGMKKGNKTLFQFDPIEFEKSHRVVITMNEEISSISKNMDGKACFLIHEFIHAIQANNRAMLGIRNESIFSYPDEQQAWESQVYLYQRIHPEIRNINCDCDSYKIIIDTPEKQIICSDPLARNFILFRFCKDKFLRTLYNADE